MKSPIAHIDQPKYLQIARTLFNEIQSGIYEVGSFLPTEHELCKQFGISRFTTREALKRLTQLGVVTRRAGIGTRVITRRPQTLYQQTLDSVESIYQYASETSLKVTHAHAVTIDAHTAEMLSAEEGEVWLNVLGNRFVPGNTVPIAYTEIWICPTFRSVKGLKGALCRAVHSYIEEQFGECIATVEQIIDAVEMDKKSANVLMVKPGTPGLKISRRYRNNQGDLIQHASSVHAAGYFSYRSEFQREWKGEDGRPLK